MVNGHVVTVDVFVRSGSEAEATDGIGEMLRASEREGEAIDWRISKVVPIGLPDSMARQEGRVFEIIDSYCRPLDAICAEGR
jgi:hypothetical protein